MQLYHCCKFGVPFGGVPNYLTFQPPHFPVHWSIQTRKTKSQAVPIVGRKWLYSCLNLHTASFFWAREKKGNAYILAQKPESEMCKAVPFYTPTSPRVEGVEETLSDRQPGGLSLTVASPSQVREPSVIGRRLHGWDCPSWRSITHSLLAIPEPQGDRINLKSGGRKGPPRIRLPPTQCCDLWGKNILPWGGSSCVS